ncbi:type II toxin-antitoxin system VapB family antitoxin [Pararhizobium sp. PWRC1-1]|uniref:type II toxin-antitoxin system VapB family antitoxin n=1 Tax=Pararhizobium sp. PWRC1-1 TaxID=2804566 RepID=UPI003CFB179E
MALFIRDDDALAAQLPTGLQRELDRVQQQRQLRDRIAKAQAMVGAMGASNPNFDMKTFTDG